MAEILQFRSKRGRRRKAPLEVSLAVEQNICSDADLRNLIDVWIVPKMVEDWVAHAHAIKAVSTDDNGEHK